MITRREFLKYSAYLGGAAILRPWLELAQLQTEWPDAERLGRNATGGWVNIRDTPSPYGKSLGVLYEDAIIVWLREVVGETTSISRRWIETPEGYVFAPAIQPVRNLPNEPVTELPTYSNLGRGMWVEVTVPMVDIYLDRPACSEWLKHLDFPRLYYSQVIWVDDVKTNSQGKVLYRVNEKYGNCGDIYWAAAEAFRPITEEEIAPIHPDIENKRIVVDLNHQILSCYEGNSEVYYCRVSTGRAFNADGSEVERPLTPLGPHPVYRKLISLHMGGSAIGTGWDTPGIGWTSLITGEGVAIHSTFWHNSYGTPVSHGCINAKPDDAKWIWRWTYPHVNYDPGDLDISANWPPSGTVVNVIRA